MEEKKPIKDKKEEKGSKIRWRTKKKHRDGENNKERKDKPRCG